MVARYLKLFLGILLLALSSNSYSQGVWEIQNPKPTSEALNGSYCLPGSSTTWAVGNHGTIVKTFDGGNNWVNLNSGTTSYLNDVFFYDSNNGFAVGYAGIILKTINGGNSWNKITSGVNVDLNSIYFVNASLGFIAGGIINGGSGRILETTDGGNTWSLKKSYQYELYDIFFSNGSLGWACGGNGTILKTTDGGESWAAQTTGTNESLRNIYFTDISTGYSCGTNGIVIKSTNSGSNWVSVITGVSCLLEDCYFANANMGWATGDDYIINTSNGGSNWTIQRQNVIDNNLCMCFANSTTGWVIGNRILKTSNGGTNWLIQTKGESNLLSGLKMIDESTGWAVGALGTILKTANGGSDWDSQISGTDKGLFDVQFLDANNGWVTGEQGKIFNTTNGGLTWNLQTSNSTDYLYSLFFISPITGWVSGGPGTLTSGTILSTSNGGATWTSKTIGPKPIKYIRFFDSDNGLAFAPGSPSSSLIKTTNGGANWSVQTLTNRAFNYVSFINSTTGWAVTNNQIYKTTTGGSLWTYLYSTTSGIGTIYFYDQNNGWVFTSDCVVKTTDGGVSWSVEAIPVQSGLLCTSFPNVKTGWAAGCDGSILHYTNFSPTSQSTSVVSSGTTYQNVNLSWSRGNGNQCAVFIKQTSSGSCIPDVNVTYLPNAAFGMGDQISSTGWYCVYNGTGTSASITGLQPNTSYRVQVCEYNFTPDFVHYNSSIATSNPITVTCSIAPPQITSNPIPRIICETASTTFASTASGTSLSYKWQVNQGAGYINIIDGGPYSGSATATLSLTGAAASLNGYKYQCVVSNTSGSATSGEALLTVNPLPVNPSLISGDTVVCLNSSYNYSVSPVSYATSYTWTLPFGFSGTSTTNTLTAQTGQDAITGMITVKGSNACGSGPVRNLDVRVKQVPGNASAISGLSTVCTGAVNTGYYTDPVNGADYYIWTYPFGASGTSNTNSIMITYGTEPLTGQISVKGHNMCGDGVLSSLPVTVTTVPSAIGSISGVSNACRNQGDVSYSVTSIPNATSYLWSLPNGVTGSNSTSGVLLKFGPDAASGDLKVSGVNTCGTGGEIVLPVTVNEAPSQLGNISGAVSVCRGQTNVMYTVPLSERATSYKWELPDGSTETTLTNKIVLNFTSDAVSGNLYATPLNSCGAGGGSNLYINVSVPVKPVISISDNYVAGACMSETRVRLSVTKSTGYTYQWFKNGIQIENVSENYIEDFLPAGDYTVSADLNGCEVLSDNVNLHYAASPDKPEIYAQGPTIWYLACSNTSAYKYKWYFNDQLIEGADKYFYTANHKLGKYHVSIANDKGCYTRSDAISVPPGITAVENADPFSDLRIYPNPTPGLLTIEMDNNVFGELSIDIFNQPGSKVLNIKFDKTTDHFKSQIDLSGQAKGMYMINLFLEKYFATRKVMVE